MLMGYLGKDFEEDDYDAMNVDGDVITVFPGHLDPAVPHLCC